MLTIASALAFDTADPYRHWRGWPSGDGGFPGAAILAYRHGEAEGEPELYLLADTGPTLVPVTTSFTDAGRFAHYRVTPADPLFPGRDYRLAWDDDTAVLRFSTLDTGTPSGPPELLSAAVFEWEAAYDTGALTHWCGVDFQFAGEDRAVEAWEETYSAAEAAGWSLLAELGDGTFVMMEPSRSYWARYNGTPEALTEYAFQLWWVSPRGEWVAGEALSRNTGACAYTEVLDTGDSGAGDVPEGDSGDDDTADDKDDAGDDCSCQEGAGATAVFAAALALLRRPAALTRT